MTGDATKARECFQDTLREAALRAARGEPASNRLWFFQDARWRCIMAAESGLQAEEGEIEEAELPHHSPAQIEQLLPEQLAVWIAGAPEPQRSALAAFYLDEFSLPEMRALLELKPPEISELVARGRRQFQAWLDTTTPHYEE